VTDPARARRGRVQLPFAESLSTGAWAERLVARPPPPVLIFVGGIAEDALAGRPSAGIGPGEDAVFRDLFPRVGPALAAGSPCCPGDAGPTGFRGGHRRRSDNRWWAMSWQSRGARRRRRPRRRPSASEAVSAWPRLAGVALLCLGVLTLMGWAGAGCRSRRAPGISACWRLAFGAGSRRALSAVALVLVHVGVRPTAGGAWASAAIAFGASAIAGWASRRAPAVPTPR